MSEVVLSNTVRHIQVSADLMLMLTCSIMIMLIVMMVVLNVVVKGSRM